MTPVWLATIYAVFVVLQSPLPGTPDAKELGAQAIRLGIPMPPKDAVLVVAYVQGYVMGSPVDDDDDNPASYTPAFLIEEKADGSVVVFRRFEREIVRPLRKDLPAWRKFSLDPVDPKTAKYSVDFGLDSYVCAAQVAARGDLALARDILKRFDEGGSWFGNENLSTVYRDPRMLLGKYWIERQLLDLIPKGPAHWRAAHDGLKAVLGEFPFSSSVDLRELVDDLALTLRAKPPAAGSTEALLLEWAAQPIMGDVFGEFDGEKANVPARALVARGFDAIPDLIALLDDRRVTAHESPPFNNSPASNLRVGTLAVVLLRETTHADVRPADDESATDAWRAWWAKARVRPERDYFLGAVFEMNDGNIVGVRAGPAHVLGQKFPDSLQALCADFTKRATPEAHPSELVAAVSASTLPKAERIKTLVAFAQRGTLSHRRSVLLELVDLDAPECARILLPLVEKLPKDVDGRYFATAEAGLGYVVAKLDDDAIWRAYLAAARRASVGLRVEMLDSVCDSRPEAKNRVRRMAFLAAFLDDEAVRDAKTDPKKFDGASGAHILPRVAVRDYAARSIAWMFGLKVRPDEAWDAAKWEELRRKVRAELAREKLPDFAPKR